MTAVRPFLEETKFLFVRYGQKLGSGSAGLSTEVVQGYLDSLIVVEHTRIIEFALALTLQPDSQHAFLFNSNFFGGFNHTAFQAGRIFPAFCCANIAKYIDSEGELKWTRELNEVCIQTKSVFPFPFIVYRANPTFCLDVRTRKHHKGYLLQQPSSFSPYQNRRWFKTLLRYEKGCTSPCCR